MVKKGLFRRAHKQVDGDTKRTLRERGASMVEFALIAPLFFAIVFSGIEIGLLFRTYLAVENLSRATARIASIERSSPDADQAILDEIARLTGPLQGDVTEIIIFNAPTLDSGLPAACTCQIYGVTDGDVTTASLDFNTWPSSARAAGDNIGIYIEIEYRFATGFFDTMDLSTTTVEVIEQDL